jgi:hypothetical protein
MPYGSMPIDVGQLKASPSSEANGANYPPIGTARAGERHEQASPV